MTGNPPGHVAIIPDGNRRCARRLMKTPWKGHEWGISKVKKLFDWTRDMGIKTITFYALSLENIDKRPKREIGYLYSLAKKETDDIAKNKGNFAHRNRIKVTFFGNLHLLPRELRESMLKAMEATKDYGSYTINFAIAYGGRQEMTEACQRIAAGVAAGRIRPSDIDETVIKHNLQTNGYGDPDLIIRTGGEKRLSNFLLFQSAYSELAFVDTLWPEFSEAEFKQVVGEYMKRDRRFGK